MFISNYKDIKNTNLFCCNKIVGKYLIKKGIPLLSRGDIYMVFANTEKLRDTVKHMPFYLRIFIKRGCF